MRLFPAALLLPSLACLTALGQAAPAASTASATLAPALAQISTALGAVRLDKWKAPGAVRQDANADMTSISQDLDGTLPPLLATADQSPGSMTGLLPVFRNVDALYDVLLRVNEAAGRGAPHAQQGALADALAALETARRSIGDLLTQAAVTEDQQVATLQARLKQVQPPTPVPDCTPPRPVRKPVHPPVHHHHTEPHTDSTQPPQ